MRTFRNIFLLSAIAFSTLAFAEVKSADVIMAESFARAKAEKKTVMLSFHASWCGWCHKFEAFIKRPEIKKIWDKRFVMTWLTVMESPEKKADNNPGGDAWLKKVGGEGTGIPYIAIFNSAGEMKVNSTRPVDAKIANDKGGNTGYPAAPEEIAWFMKMLEKGAPNVTSAERATIEAGLKEEAKKLGK